ncbi:TonB-dependent receptor [Roseateles cavernae]|uniref:TonB-dependent receptor n=1 Tax=Roseateles cavernae TaxID=3153578 RepID=UPI0032E4AB87
MIANKTACLRLALVPAAILAGFGASGQAMAQSSTEAPTALERVTVSATKRLTFVQDTPLAVTALTQKELDRAGVKDLLTMQALVPNLSIEQHGDSGGVHVFLRGIGSTNHTELGDPAVAFHVDGVYSPRPQGATVLMYDLESVEVARGPQGTLFGRNATAGSVNLNTAKPKLGQFGGSGSMLLGDRNRTTLQGALNVPLGETLALRVAAIQEKQDGWVDFQARSNVQPGARKYGASDQAGVRSTLLWEPSPALTATVAAEYYRDQGTGQVSLMQQPRPGQKLRSALIDTPGHLDQDIITYRGRVDWRPSDAIEVSYIGSWSRLKRQNASDNDAGTQPGFKQEHRTEWSQFDNYTHEVNLKSTGSGPFQWIAGAFMIKEDNKIRFDIDISKTAVAAGAGPIVINPVLPTDVAWAMSFIQPKRTLDSKAVFGQGTFAFTKDLKLTAGARYTDEKKQDVGGRNWVCPDFGATIANGGRLIGPGGPVDVASCGSVHAPGTWPGGGANDGRTSDDASTYLLRGEFKASPDLLTYATLSTGFKSGGLSDGGRRHLPEKLTNVELGAKAEFFQRSLALNLAAFWMKYKDMQVSAIEYQPNGQQQLVTSNAAKATIKGVEAELSWRLTRDARLMGNASVLNAQYDDFLTCDSALLDCNNTANFVNLKGSKLPHAPKFSTTLAFEHDFALGSGRLTPRIGVHYQARSYLSNFNTAPTAAVKPGSFAEARTQKAYSKVDLSLRYEDGKGRWELEAFVNNATDKMVKTDASWIGDTSTWVSFYNPPRTYGVKAAYRF